MKYGLYQRIYGVIYFTELAVDINIIMRENIVMVDLLIMEKMQVLNKDAKPYIPAEKQTSKEAHNENETVGNQEQQGKSIQEENKLASIVKESLELLCETVEEDDTEELEENIEQLSFSKEKETIDNSMEYGVMNSTEGVEIEEVGKSEEVIKETDIKINHKGNYYNNNYYGILFEEVAESETEISEERSNGEEYSEVILI